MQCLNCYLQAIIYKLQALIDSLQAVIDKLRAVIDKLQAVIDKLQVVIDKLEVDTLQIVIYLFTVVIDIIDKLNVQIKISLKLLFANSKLKILYHKCELKGTGWNLLVGLFSIIQVIFYFGNNLKILIVFFGIFTRLHFNYSNTSI